MHFSLGEHDGAVTDILARIKAHFLKDPYTSGHVYFAQSGVFALLLHVEQAQGDIQIRVRVIVHIHTLDKRFAGVKIKLFDLVGRAFMHVDRVFVKQHRHRKTVHFTDHADMRRICRIHDQEVLCHGGSQGDLTGREILLGPVIGLSDMSEDICV